MKPHVRRLMAQVPRPTEKYAELFGTGMVPFSGYQGGNVIGLAAEKDREGMFYYRAPFKLVFECGDWERGEDRYFMHIHARLVRI